MYVDGFVAAVPTANRERYRKHAEAAAVVFKEHGATRFVECWGDDVPEGKLTSFPMAVKCQDDEDGRLFVDHVAIARGARPGHAEGDGRPAHSTGPESDALRWQAADLWRLRSAGRRLKSCIALRASALRRGAAAHQIRRKFAAMYPPYTRRYEHWAPVVGRVLFGLQFLIAAVFKVIGFSGEVAQTAAAGVPFAALAVALAFVLEAIAAIGLLIGWQVRAIAFVLAPYVLLLALIFYHNLADQLQFGFFVSHLSMIAGLLYVSVYGAQSAAVRKDALPQAVEA